MELRETMQLKEIASAMIVFVVILIAATPAISQMSENPEEVGTKIREMGSDLTNDVVKGTAELYLPLHVQTPKNGVKITKDQSYGPHKRNRLDVYEPENKSSRMMPILLFIHGGAFISGDKNLTGIFAPYYGNIGTYFARHGVVTVLATYRLAPEHKWPAGAEDIAKAIKWIRANGATFGGDSNKIFLMGHSAGACHAGTYIFNEELQSDKGDGVLGAILMSGLYDPRVAAVPIEANPSYYGKDASKYASMAAIRHIEGREVPVFIVFSELDPDFFHMQAAELFRALCQRDNSCPRIKQLANHNHMSEVYHINTADESIGPEILDFIQSNIR